MDAPKLAVFLEDIRHRVASLQKDVKAGAVDVSDILAVLDRLTDAVEAVAHDADLV